jgi:iron complex transport system ATP-binding protein
MKKTIETHDLMIGYRRPMSGYSGSISRRMNISTVSGELLAVAGPNGAGKSTLLRTLAGLQKQVDGKITLCGKALSDYARKELARTISFVSTEPIQVPYLKVFDLAAMGRYPYTQQMGRLNTADKLRVVEALEWVGAQHLIWRHLDTLSDGERQRVMIARILVQDTPVVLFDEPTAYLDIFNKYEMLALLKRLAYRQQKTIIYSTHDIAMALNMADKLWLMADATVYEGAPEDADIQVAMKQLFDGSHLEYNRSTGEIAPKSLMQGEVEVFCRQDARLIRNALARLGYQCLLNPSKPNATLPQLTVTSKKGHTTIDYRCGKTERQFTSYYEFCRFMKKASQKM